MPLHGEHAAGAAMRRRQRRLRSWLRHERMTVAMTLAEMTHHAAPRGPNMARAGEEVEHATHSGPRAQKTPPPGERPGILAEPGPQRSDRTVRRSAGNSLPTPGLPVLAGASGEAVDSSTLSFLVQLAVKDRKREEAKERRRSFPRYPWLPSDDGTHWYNTETDETRLYPPSSSSGARRKRKKRRKKKTPKSSSFRSSSGVRPRRCGQGSRSRSSSSGGCGRLREHVRQVPAVADLQWKVPPSISSTKWWTFQLCYGDRYCCLQVQFSDKVVSLPGVVLRPRECKNLWSSHRCSSWTRLFSCPVLCLTGRRAQFVEKTVVIIPLVVQRPIPMVQAVSADHGDFPVAVH